MRHLQLITLLDVFVSARCLHPCFAKFLCVLRPTLTSVPAAARRNNRQEDQVLETLLREEMCELTGEDIEIEPADI